MLRWLILPYLLHVVRITDVEACMKKRLGSSDLYFSMYWLFRSKTNFFIVSLSISSSKYKSSCDHWQSMTTVISVLGLFLVLILICVSGNQSSFLWEKDWKPKSSKRLFFEVHEKLQRQIWTVIMFEVSWFWVLRWLYYIPLVCKCENVLYLGVKCKTCYLESSSVSREMLLE